MSRRTYAWLTTSLLVLGAFLFFGSIAALQMDCLQQADFLIRFAVSPGGLIAGGIVVLINGCVEHYADFLPSKYRKRRSTRSEWESVYDTDRMYVVESVLKRFARSHGFRITDAFQFGPEDRIEELIEDFYPGRSDPDALFRQADLTSSVADASTHLCLREYVDARIGPAIEHSPEPEHGSGKVDRQARNRLVSAIRRYMDETLAAFAFDEEINDIRGASADETVQFVVDSLWLHYDDCKDHLAGLSKQEWDYFQRLILLLESDAEIDRVRQRRWSIRQAVAGICLIGFGLCVSQFGVGWHLFGFALLFGPASLLLSYWRNHSETWQSEERLHLAPFSSISELRAVRKAVRGFSKKRYPRDAKIRRVHSRLMTMVVWIQTIVLWSFVSPLILLFQMLPEKEMHTRIRQEAV
ncbi:MAG TPA: hypothetical protein VE890_18210 [Thermoguttaceae bacterium]|nr:hypothetical protein [Thermoguttaceae bacterium]